MEIKKSYITDESETVVRIISARKADGDEENEYWRHRR